MQQGNLMLPKQWDLGRKASVQDFECWKNNILSYFMLNPLYRPFLKLTWMRKSRSCPNRGFTDDNPSLIKTNPHTAEEKAEITRLMLTHIANWVRVISTSTIVDESTSIEDAWQKVRLHFNINITGSRILDLPEISQQLEDSPEDLYQRLKQHLAECMMATSNLKHHGATPREADDLTPTLENWLTTEWLRKLHPKLPQLVKREYAIQLQEVTIASIRSEISAAIPYLLEKAKGEASPCEVQAATVRPQRQRPRPKRSCPICIAKNCPSDHYLSECRYLPEADRRWMTKARAVAVMLEEPNDENHPDMLSDTLDTALSFDTRPDPDVEPNNNPISALQVQVRQSPILQAFHNNNHSVNLTLDTGATGNVINADLAQRLKLTIHKSNQQVSQADGSPPLHVIGETSLHLTRDHHTFILDGLVVTNLDCDILAGTPFLTTNDICIRPAKRQVLFADGCTYSYGTQAVENPLSCQRVTTAILRAPPTPTTIWPGDSITVTIPDSL